MTGTDRMKAYERLTRQLRTMHHTERTILDTDLFFEAILAAVHEGRDQDALDMAQHIRTAAGDAWRARRI